MRLGVVGLAARVQPADGEPDPGLELGRAGGVQHDVVHAPVVGDDGEPALGHDEQHRDVGAGGADQPAQVAGVGELEPTVDEQQVGVGGLEQGAALGGQDLDLVAEQGQSRAAPRPRAAARWSAGAACSSGSPHAERAEQHGWARTSLADGEGYRAMGSVSDGGEPVETREPSGVVTVRYWAAARAAAGVAADDLPVDGPVTLADLRERAVALHPGTRLEAVLGVCSALVGDRPVGIPGPGRRSWSGRARPWSSCRPSPAAERPLIPRNVPAPRRGCARRDDRTVGAARWRAVRGRASRSTGSATDGRFRGTHRVRGSASPMLRRRSRRPRPCWPPPGSPYPSASGPRCCSSPRRSARRAAPPAGARRGRRPGPGCHARRGRRRAPPGGGPRRCGCCARRPPWSWTPPAARSPARPACPERDQVLAALAARVLMSASWTVHPHDETGRTARGSGAAYSGRHVLDHADQAPRSGSLPRALGAVSNVLTGRDPPDRRISTD